MVTGYRMFRVLEQAVQTGIIDILDAGAKTVDELLSSTGLRPEEGERFIACLLEIGILTEKNGALSLSTFSRNWLANSSPTSQRGVLEFEPILMDNWGKIGNILQKGQGALIKERSTNQYKERLKLYQKAMGEAAAVRSAELWDAVTDLPEDGTIIDIGAGRGTYLQKFLEKHPTWQAVACDLPDVCGEVSTDLIPHNLKFYPCNILNRQELDELVTTYRASADLLLFSNVCHCYSRDENLPLLQKSGAMLKKAGALIIHDFFRNANNCGALYDLHMLVNTYNGRSYSTSETTDMLHDSGFMQQVTIELPSRSVAIVATKRGSVRLDQATGALFNRS